MISLIKATKIRLHHLVLERLEQYQDFRINLGLSASHDDLRTSGTASDALKKRLAHLANLLEITILLSIKEIEHSNLPMDQF